MSDKRVPKLRLTIPKTTKRARSVAPPPIPAKEEEETPDPKKPKQLKSKECPENLELEKKKQEKLEELKSAEVRVQKEQLKKAVDAVKSTIQYNDNQDLLSTSKALDKLKSVQERVRRTKNFSKLLSQ